MPSDKAAETITIKKAVMANTHEQSLLYLWNLRTLYIGPLFDVASILPAASSLVVGIDGPFELQVLPNAAPIHTRVALLPAGVPFGADTGDKIVASLYLDPVGRDLAVLRQCAKHCTGGIYHDSDDDEALVSLFREIARQQPPPPAVYQLLREQVFFNFNGNASTPEVDPRIWQAINYIKLNAMENFSSESLAAAVGMPEPQLRRSFKQATGIPLRRYRRWHRLFITATLMACGKTLTEAALTAGFSDSSHFNHAFREMLGAKPSSLLRRKDNIRIFIGQENDY